VENKSDQLTFWLEESPASPPASPAAEKALPTTAGYGQTFFDWPQKHYPSGSWQRTLLELLQSNLTDLSGSTKAWNRRVTKSSRSLWVLTTVERLTDESGHGSLLDWPTPTASEYGSSNNGCPGDGRMEYATKGRPNLQTMAKEWATPQAHDVQLGDPDRPDRFGTRHGGRNLNDEVAASWPTPKAADGRAKGNGGNRNSPGLEQMVGQGDPTICSWPTPTAQDSEQAGGKGSIQRGKRGFSLHQATQNWPTATAGDAKGSGSRNLPGSKAHPGTSLTDATVHHPWATPIARDSRTFKGSGSKPGRQGADPLSLQVSQTDGQPDAASLNTNGSRRESSKSRLRLSASWVACLMGLPNEWGCVSIDRALKLWGTASSRKTPAKSDSPLPDAKG
jgi:hypothetical protein